MPRDGFAALLQLGFRLPPRANAAARLVRALAEAVSRERLWRVDHGRDLPQPCRLEGGSRNPEGP